MHTESIRSQDLEEQAGIEGQAAKESSNSFIQVVQLMQAHSNQWQASTSSGCLLGWIRQP
jgi:hypothetical protein